MSYLARSGEPGGLMKVLVTGGAGYVGSHVVWTLQQAGHEVVILDDLSTGHRSTVERLDATLEEVDLRDPDAARRVVVGKGFEAVCHLAAFPLVPECERAPEQAWGINVSGGLNLLDACREAGLRRFVFTSSAAVYGNPGGTGTISERSASNAVSVYGRTKAALEDALRDHIRAYGGRAVILRVFNVGGSNVDAGIGEDHAIETHLIPRLLEVAAHGGGGVEVFGTDYSTEDGSAVRDYVHVMDVARAHLLALERTGIAGDGETDVFNVGTGTPTSVREVVSCVDSTCGTSLDVVERQRRVGDPASLVADPTEARQELGFTATRSALEEIVQSAWAWTQREDRSASSRLRAVDGNGGRTARPSARVAVSASDPGRLRAPRDSGRLRSSGSGRVTAMRRSPRFGEMARRRGFITEDALTTALDLQRKRSAAGESHKLLGIILLEMGAIDSTQLIDTLRQMNTTARR